MKIDLLNFLVAKPAAYLAGRFGGQAAANKAAQVAQETAQREIRAKKPVILSAIDTAVVGLEAEVGAIVPVLINVARGRIVDEIATLGLSTDAQSAVGQAIAATAAPAVAQADKIISSFAAAVKAAIAAI